MDHGVDILLVEDDASDELLALHAFKRQNSARNVHVVRDGGEALEYLYCTGAYADRSSHNPKVVLLDVNLPLVDGVEVLRRIRSDPRTQYIPVVIFTSANDDRLIEIRELGVNRYIIKPTDIAQYDEIARRLAHYWLPLDLQATSVPSQPLKDQPAVDSSPHLLPTAFIWKPFS